MMTLDEAIEHAELVANNCEGECSEEHRQLAEWLRELKRLKAENAQLKAKADAQWSHIEKLQAELSHCIEKSRRDYDRDLDMRRRLATENAKLRDFIELLLSCPRDSGECKECRRLNDLCAVELEAGKLGIEVEP